jgi:hypothetical protein
MHSLIDTVRPAARRKTTKITWINRHPAAQTMGNPATFEEIAPATATRRLHRWRGIGEQFYRYNIGHTTSLLTMCGGASSPAKTLPRR